MGLAKWFKRSTKEGADTANRQDVTVSRVDPDDKRATSGPINLAADAGERVIRETDESKDVVTAILEKAQEASREVGSGDPISVRLDSTHLVVQAEQAMLGLLLHSGKYGVRWVSTTNSVCNFEKE